MAAAVSPMRISGGSDNSFAAMSRHNTGSTATGTRSARQSKRVSVTAYYLSMSASKEKDLDIEDDLAKGNNRPEWRASVATLMNMQPRRYYVVSRARFLPSQSVTLSSRKMLDISIRELHCLYKTVCD